MDKRKKKDGSDVSHMPAPISDEKRDELIVVQSDELPAQPKDGASGSDGKLMIISDGELPADPVARQPSTGDAVEFNAAHTDESMRGGYASVKQDGAVRTDNKIVWIVLAVMAVMCIVIGVCSSLLTAHFMRKGDKPPVINTNGDVQQNIAAVVTARKSSVVEISCGGLSSSGIVMKRDGDKVIVLTNAHAIAQYVATRRQPLVRFYGEDSYYESTVLGYNGHYDVAVLQVAAADLKYVVYDIDGNDVLLTDASYAEGDYVVSIGNAMSMGIACYDGIISRKSELLECNELFGAEGKKTVPVMRTTAVINAGMSGGGVFDMKGRLIGLGTYRMSSTGNVNTDGGSSNTDVEDTGFATPMSIVYPVYKRILEVADGGSVGVFAVNTQKSNSAIGWLGVTALGFNCEYKQGKLTVGTVSDGGVKSGDVIEKIGGYSVGTDICETVGTFLRYRKNGDGGVLTLTVSRDGARHTVKYDDYRYAL